MLGWRAERNVSTNPKKRLSFKEANVCLLRGARLFAQSETTWKSLVHQASGLAKEISNIETFGKPM